MERIEIGEVSLELFKAGAGPPLLFLHGGDYFLQNRMFLDELARHWRVLAPRHPGFGRSERPDGFRTVHDLAYLYLDLIEQQRLDDAVLVGSSFGGWIALEMCVRSVARIGHVALIDALGLKFGPTSTPFPKTSCSAEPFSIRPAPCRITASSTTTS